MFIIVGPLHFNVDFCNMFSLDNACDVVSYADENMPYIQVKSEDPFIKKLENSCSDIFKYLKKPLESYS